MRGSLFRHQLGDGRLVPGGGEGEGQGQHRAQQLVNAHPLLPEQPGEIDAVQEADEPADDAGGGEDKGAHDQRMTLFRFHIHRQTFVFHQYILFGQLTEQGVGAILIPSCMV